MISLPFRSSCPEREREETLPLFLKQRRRATEPPQSRSLKGKLHTRIRFPMDTLLFLCLSFGVFAVDGVESVSATEGDSVTLSTGVILKHPTDKILYYWHIGLNKTCWAKVQLLNTSIYDDICNETFKDRLQFDRHTGSLTIMNITTTDSGLYKLMFIVNRSTTTKTFNVSVTAVPVTAPGRPPGQRSRWPMYVALVLAGLTVVILLYCCWRKRRRDQAGLNDPEGEQQLQDCNREGPVHAVVGLKWKSFNLKFWENQIKQGDQHLHQEV